MNSLKVPESGLQLECSPGNESNLPPQAFAMTLSDNVIEDMIQCFRNGDDIQIALGAHPTFLYGSQKHVIQPPSDYPYDLYLTKPFESTRKAERLPCAGSLFKAAAPKTKSSADSTEREVDARPKGTKTNKSSGSLGLNPDIEALQNELAAHEASREKARVIDLSGNKKGAVKPKAKLLSGHSTTPRSLPPSPALRATGSASPPVLSASQQHVERAKEQRVVFVHELAVQDRSLDYLKKKWIGKEEDLRPTLAKVANQLPSTDKWSMKKAYWKELDVWNYDYDTQELRDKAIENAIRHYDRQRLSASEPEWQKLLPKEERGQGKCLSRLQAELAKGPPPKIKVQKADGSSTPNDSDGELTKSKMGGENMSRSSSGGISKTKKKGSSDAQVKRLLGNSKPKAAPVKSSSTIKAAATKVSTTKPKAAVIKANGGRVLSKEIIENSDSSGDEAPPPPKRMVKPPPKVEAKPAAPKPAPKPVSKLNGSTIVVKPRVATKEPVKSQGMKRPREGDDSSSSSGTPLSKRIKSKQVMAGPPVKHRPSDASQNSRSTATTNSSYKSKNTSPTKSSPLASSPPTNASDLEHDDLASISRKRKAEAEIKSSKIKKAAKVPMDLMQKANRFKTFYQQYEALHYEISGLDNPPNDKVADLLDMRHRLVGMKEEIYKECPPERA